MQLGFILFCIYMHSLHAFYYQKCLRICNVEIYSPFYLLDKITDLKFKRILNDNSHPLYNQIIFSKRREGRLLSITTKTERHRKSFLPRAVRSVHKLTQISFIYNEQCLVIICVSCAYFNCHNLTFDLRIVSLYFLIAQLISLSVLSNVKLLLPVSCTLFSLM